MARGAKVYQMWFWTCDECDFDCNDSYDGAKEAQVSAFRHNHEVHGVNHCPRSGMHVRGQRVCWLCESVLRPTIAQVAPSVSK